MASLNYFYGLYKGIVEDNNDPQKRNRLKIRIGEIYGNSARGLSTSSLPWSMPASPLLTNPPLPIGSIAYVMFEKGDPGFPVYLGYMLKMNVSSQCYKCQNLTGAQLCKAFPNGIPDELYFNEVSHESPYEGDNGIIFKEKK